MCVSAGRGKAEDDNIVVNSVADVLPLPVVTEVTNPIVIPVLDVVTVLSGSPEVVVAIADTKEEIEEAADASVLEVVDAAAAVPLKEPKLMPICA